MKASVYRKEKFNAAHRIYRKDWSDEKNNNVFGKCANPNYHGHNYDLIVKVSGEIDPETGYVMDMKKLSDIINDHVIEKLDHKNMNLDIEEFVDLIPSAENIARVIWEILRDKIETSVDLKVILYETERNFVEYPAD